MYIKEWQTNPWVGGGMGGPVIQNHSSNHQTLSDAKRYTKDQFNVVVYKKPTILFKANKPVGSIPIAPPN